MPRSKPDIVRRLFGAYMSKDRAALEELLTEDFRFTSPYDDAIDKATYFERCWPNSGLIREHVLEKILVQGEEAFVLYRCLTQDGKEFRNTELITFAGDRVKRVDVYFGATYKAGAFVRQSDA